MNGNVIEEYPINNQIESKYSKYLNGKTIPFFDSKISECLRPLRMDEGGKDMLIGIENEEGEVYRVLKSTGMGAYISVVEALLKLGLRDELAEVVNSKTGLDSLLQLTDEALRNFKSSCFRERPLITDDLASEVSSFESLPETERESLIQSRLGQGQFRQSLIVYWKSCAVTDCAFTPLLRASHIKPWRDSTNRERIDLFNGLLLSPNLDMAFDQGYISFDGKGKIIISPQLKPNDAYSLRITPKLKIKPKLLTDEHLRYLQFHNDNVLLK